LIFALASGENQRGGLSQSLNFGNVIPSPLSSNTTSTAMPILTLSIGEPMMLLQKRGPSSRSTQAVTYGMSGAKPRRACPTTSRITVNEKILPFPLSSTHSSLSLAHSPQTGRGQKTQLPHSWHFCIISLPALAPSQNGWLTGVISGKGFRISSFAILLNLSVLLYVKIFSPRHRNQNPKSEARNPKQTRRLKSQLRNPKPARLELSDF